MPASKEIDHSMNGEKAHRKSETSLVHYIMPRGWAKCLLIDGDKWSPLLRKTYRWVWSLGYRPRGLEHFWPRSQILGRTLALNTLLSFLINRISKMANWWHRRFPTQFWTKPFFTRLGAVCRKWTPVHLRYGRKYYSGNYQWILFGLPKNKRLCVLRIDLTPSTWSLFNTLLKDSNCSRNPHRTAISICCFIYFNTTGKPIRRLWYVVHDNTKRRGKSVLLLNCM